MLEIEDKLVQENGCRSGGIRDPEFLRLLVRSPRAAGEIETSHALVRPPIDHPVVSHRKDIERAEPDVRPPEHMARTPRYANGVRHGTARSYGGDELVVVVLGDLRFRHEIRLLGLVGG